MPSPLAVTVRPTRTDIAPRRCVGRTVRWTVLVILAVFLTVSVRIVVLLAILLCHRVTPVVFVNCNVPEGMLLDGLYYGEC
ncbi:MAG TPA: hypothetical protein VN622_05995 [Clostridia bacterium]|nr:hypothetical protein [Clostridia bacterium]